MAHGFRLVKIKFAKVLLTLLIIVIIIIIIIVVVVVVVVVVVWVDSISSFVLFHPHALLEIWLSLQEGSIYN